MYRKCSILLLMVLAFILGIATPVYADGIRLPSSLMRIDEEAFENTNLDSVKIPYGTTRIEARAFANSSVRNVRFPRSVSFIADDAFLNCPNVTLEVLQGSYAYEWAKNHGIQYSVYELTGQYVLTVAFSQSITAPEGQILLEISDNLYEATEGRYSLEIYPDASLGDQAQTFELTA